MKNVTELDLYDLPIGEQLFANDPNPHMIAAREKHPWLATSAFGYVITEYGAVDELLRMDDKLKTPSEHLIEIMGAEGTNWARFERECLIALDGAEHERIRSAVNKAFLPKAVNSYRSRIQEVVTDSGPFDTPIDFVPGRANGKRFTVFGRGIHICLGQFLARLQIAEGLHLIAQRLKNPRRDGELLWRLFPGVWGPKQLPIAFDAA